MQPKDLTRAVHIVYGPKGGVEVLTVFPDRLEFATMEWNGRDEWVLVVLDENGKERRLALQDIASWQPVLKTYET